MIVRWETSALSELAEEWLRSDSGDRRLVVAAAAEIDRQLLVSPDTLGESRADDARVLFIPPLGVLFHVGKDFVSVLHIWNMRKAR